MGLKFLKIPKHLTFHAYKLKSDHKLKKLGQTGVVQ